MSESEAPPALTCARCQKEIPEGQRVEHRGAVYCMDCIGQALNGAAPPTTKRRRDPALAVVLSLMPGLGQMYNHQVLKGVLVMGGFMVLAMNLGEGPFGDSGFSTAALVVLYFWNLFDAYWGAQRINRADLPFQEPVTWAPRTTSASAPAWGVLLIVLGILFLLNNFGVTWLTWDRVWPTALLALGIWMLISFAVSRRRSVMQEPEPPPSGTSSVRAVSQLPPDSNPPQGGAS
jgi:TM2 domain-containing membrane protein YozV